MDSSGSKNINITPGFIVDGRYEIIDQIGSGGFSTVYRAKHVRMNREAAIKILSLELMSGEESNWTERFMREAQICGAFSHPNVVTIYDLGTIPETGQPYIAMELLQGYNLAVELSQNGPLAKARFYHLFRPVLDALGAGHAAGIVHRDLKPENLFIINPGTRSEFMKVMDFGISSMRRQDLKRLTMNGEILGTPRFLAPEYIKDSMVCPAGDVYQMALIMSEALSGVPAVEDNSISAMLLHTEGKINICEFLKTGSVGYVFKKAYCVEKEKRYPNCRKFCDAFDSVSRHFDSQSMAVPVVSKEIEPEIKEEIIEKDEDFNVANERHLGLLSLLCIAIGALCVLIVVYLYFRFSEQPEVVNEPSVAVAPESGTVEKTDPGLDEMSLVEPLHLCKLEETPELKSLRAEADNSTEGEEKLGVYLMRQQKCRENYDEAWKAFESVELHSDADAMYFHGLLGLKRWPQHFHVNTAAEAQEFKKYLSYIHEAAERGSLMAIASSFRFAAKPLDHKEMAHLILEAMMNEDDALSDSINWFRIVLGIQLALDDNQFDSKANSKIYGTVLNNLKTKISKAVGENDATAMTIQAMMIAKNEPDKSYQLFRKAADAGSVEANRVLAEIYMHSMTDKMYYEATFPMETYKALQKIVQNKVKSLDETDRFKLVADYIKHSGFDDLDVYSFYRAVSVNSDEFANVVLDRMKVAAVNDTHVRFQCDQLAERLGIDVTWKQKQADNIFPKSRQQKVLEIVESCYRSALEQGSDFSEIEANNTYISSGYILYLLYKNAFNYENIEIKNKMAGTLIYAAMHGDGISAGMLAEEYKKGEILPINEDRAKYWANQCVESQYCRSCQKMDLSLCSLCDDCKTVVTVGLVPEQLVL